MCWTRGHILIYSVDPLQFVVGEAIPICSKNKGEGVCVGSWDRYGPIGGIPGKKY